MLVLLDNALLVLQAKPQAASEETATPVRARLVQLVPAQCELEVTERFEQRGDGLTRLHSWLLRAGGLELQLGGTEAVQGGVEGGPDPTEALGRAVALKLGWRLP
jgi:hypothetical protein